MKQADQIRRGFEPASAPKFSEAILLAIVLVTIDLAGLILIAVKAGAS